ncbi:hypothetical protein BD413DRAFT_165420 [Trametes elegans]|nr:hypothetical protein BD413DRAFT_165420 [Trametes elegans]
MGHPPERKYHAKSCTRCKRRSCSPEQRMKLAEEQIALRCWPRREGHRRCNTSRYWPDATSVRRLTMRHVLYRLMQWPMSLPLATPAARYLLRVPPRSWGRGAIRLGARCCRELCDTGSYPYPEDHRPRASASRLKEIALCICRGYVSRSQDHALSYRTHGILAATVTVHELPHEDYDRDDESDG